MKKIAFVMLFAVAVLLYAEPKFSFIPKEQTIGFALKTGKPVVAYFWARVSTAETVALCKPATQQWEALKLPETVYRVRVDISSYARSQQLFKIKDVPTFVIFDKNGKEIARSNKVSAEWVKKVLSIK
jgi:hypothetical protein